MADPSVFSGQLNLIMVEGIGGWCQSPGRAFVRQMRRMALF
jgi:hypothetical protein